MFKENDKINLVATNMVNNEGQIVNYHISFPIYDKNFYIPKDIIQTSILEYHEDKNIYGYMSFKIGVENTTNLKHIIKSEDKSFKFSDSILESIKNSDDKLFYFIDSNGNKVVFDKVNNDDIVVEDIEKLKEILLLISDSFKNMKESISKIKSLKRNI